MALKGSLQRYRVLASAALSVLFVCPVSVDAKGDLDRFELLGPVRTVVTKHSQLRTTQEFDPGGYLIALELHPANEPTSARYVFLHDETGRLVEEHTFEPDGALAYKELFRYGFDDHGRQTALVGATDAGAFTHAELSMYDERGGLSEEIYITAHGASDKSFSDISGNVIYQARYYQGRLVQETTHRYGPRSAV